MSKKRLLLLILLLVIGGQQTTIGQDKPAVPAGEAPAKAELDRQLKINRDALLAGSGEQIRIDAATVMLESPDPLARKILLAILKQPENKAAHIAICKALNQARTEQKAIKQKSDFIQPLIQILITQDNEVAKLAAQATLIFEYEQISKPLEKLVTEPSLPTKARLNAIYALKLQPDMRAIFKLIELLDDPESQVAAQAEKALRSLGIPVGKDAQTRRQIINELKRKGKNEFLKDWLIRQEAQMRQLATELEFWRQQYLSALDKIYGNINTDAAKGKFLAHHLESPKAKVRLWALEKVSQWRKGTNPKLPPELGAILVNLISDPDRDVRLKTARLLSLMGQLNSAQKLLQQLEVEQDDEVKTELFVALGGACYYAFLPNSGIELPKDIRKQTLQWAERYLFEQETKKAEKGAEVIKKLLEQNGLTPAQIDRYLGLLAKRYNQEKDKADGTLRGELLSTMAGLCAQSVYKAESAKRFGPLFEQALSDETDLVREAAVDGLIHIDKTRTLKILRKDFVDDSSAVIRKKLINLAGEVGGKEDLLWLAEKIGTTAESEPAWQAMLTIFKRSEASVLNEWVAKFDSQNAQAKLSDEQRISFLEIAERRAVAENKPEMQKEIRVKLARLYRKIGEFERAAEYLGMLREVADSPEEKEAILADLVGVYLRGQNIEAVAQLVHNCLLEKDLDPNSTIVLTITNYLTTASDAADPNGLIKALSQLNIPEARPNWHKQLKHWTDLGQAEKMNKPKETGN